MLHLNISYFDSIEWFLTHIQVQILLVFTHLCLYINFKINSEIQRLILKPNISINFACWLVAHEYVEKKNFFFFQSSGELGRAPGRPRPYIRSIWPGAAYLLPKMQQKYFHFLRVTSQQKF